MCLKGDGDRCARDNKERKTEGRRSVDSIKMS